MEMNCLRGNCLIIINHSYLVLKPWSFYLRHKKDGLASLWRYLYFTHDSLLPPLSLKKSLTYSFVHCWFNRVILRTYNISGTLVAMGDAGVNQKHFLTHKTCTKVECFYIFIVYSLEHHKFLFSGDLIKSIMKDVDEI